MNLALSQGHAEAWHYPLGMLYDECDLIIERENNRIITEAQTLQLAMASMFGNEGRKAFTERLKVLNVQAKPRDGLFEE